LSLAEREPIRGRDPSGTIGRNIEPFLLLELVRQPSYGYDLIRRLADYGFRRATEEPGVVYKVLRALEDQGSILSTWSTQESGPARRYYEITGEGRDVLHRRIGQLRRAQERIDRLLAEYAQLGGEDSAVDETGRDDIDPQPAVSTVGGL
jgi:PadR family transcriptional regulator, regulatory protein PadR